MKLILNLLVNGFGVFVGFAASSRGASIVIDQTTGIKIIMKALEEPLRQIVNNAGLEGSVVLQKVKEGKIPQTTSLKESKQKL